MNFIIIDIIFLVLFALFASIFLYKKKKNLKKEGSLLLYKTSWGIKLIDSIGTNYKKTLKFLSYISITIGYFLMAGIVFLIGQLVYLYFTTEIAKTIKVPPIAPLIPYFPKLFGLQSFFPPFYFIYFILAIIIVATVHEFSHGIFARSFGIKIKSTGFAFLKYFPAFFGAFVEQDDKQMEKAKKFEQMSVLSAGVFANILVTILFYFILFMFFSLTFIPTGVQFNDYQYSIVEIASISMINNLQVNNLSYSEFTELVGEEKFNKITSKKENYVAIKGFSKDNEYVALYLDAPAINAEIGNIITEINEVKISSLEDLQTELEHYSFGDEIKIKTIENGIYKEYLIPLKENSYKNERPLLGIAFYENSKGIVSKILPSYKKSFVYYEPKNDFYLFIKDLLWWIVIINLLVALFNMLPLGILDGGRFFYLTILGLTGSKKFAKKTFKFITSFIIFLFLLLMVKWLLNFIL
jgi:membrane-associated protease RseP (regulator of RpoE activity)